MAEREGDERPNPVSPGEDGLAKARALIAQSHHVIKRAEQLLISSEQRLRRTTHVHDDGEAAVSDG
jgi:hypothetical protein